jgi:hypothetical protein
VVHGELAHPYVVAGTSDGSIAVVWRSIDQPLPTWALVIRAADGTVTGVGLDEPFYLTPIPGGWIAASSAQVSLVSTDGARTSLGPKSAARPARAGDVLVQTGESPVLYRPDDGSWADLPADAPHVAAYVTRDGHVLGCRRDLRRRRVEVWRDEQVVAHVRGDSCVMTGSGDTVAVAALGDAADGSIPVVALVRSDDSGQSWHELVTPQDLDLASFSIGSDGTTFVTGTDGRLVITQPDGTQFVARDEHGVGFATDDRMCALAYGQSKGPLSCSDDDGATWHETTLPGLE